MKNRYYTLRKIVAKFNEDEDDFDFGGVATAPKIDDQTGKENDGGDDKGDEEGKGEEGNEKGEEGNDKGDQEDKGSETGDEGGDKGNEGGDGDDKGDEGGDGDDKGDEKGDGDDKGDKEVTGLFDDEGDPGSEEDDFTPLATDLELELEENEKLDKQKLVEKVKGRIESAKQEFKLDALAPNARKIVDHVNKTNDLSSFFNDSQLLEYQQVLSMNDDQKYREVRSLQMKQNGLDEEQIEEKISEELENKSTREIKDFNDKIDSKMKEAINGRIDEIVSVKDEDLRKEVQKKEKEIEDERENLKKFVKNQDNFLDLPISDKDKSRFDKIIDNGEIDAYLEQNPVEAKYYAYMFLKFGDKINKSIEQRIKLAARQAKNDEVDKTLDTLHNNADGKQVKGGQSRKSNSDDRFSSWADEDL